MYNRKRFRIISLFCDVVDIQKAVDFVLAHGISRTSSYVCVSNVHMCMEGFDDPQFASVVNNADLVIPDGKPLSVMQRMLGAKGARQVRGSDLLHAICAKSNSFQNLKIGLYGGSSVEVLNQITKRLLESYPKLKIGYAYSPPFRTLTLTEDTNVVADIEESEINVLFVGIGCPKQEIWMASHKGRVNCIMIGVGAAFDFIAGSKMHAPVWVQKIGLEWLFRLLSEPRRLWRRYLKHNPRFLFHASKQIFTEMIVGKKH